MKAGNRFNYREEKREGGFRERSGLFLSFLFYYPRLPGGRSGRIYLIKKKVNIGKPPKSPMLPKLIIDLWIDDLFLYSLCVIVPIIPDEYIKNFLFLFVFPYFKFIYAKLLITHDDSR